MRPGGASLSAKEAVNAAADVLKSGVDSQSGMKSELWRAVAAIQLGLIVLLLGVQAVPFAWNGWVAYRDVRVDVAHG